ncbi:MAG: PfkB family carbohydrate kinase [Bosea sp. (in: a-proteobacteria)]
MRSVLCTGIATLDYVYGVAALPAGGTKHRANALEVVGGGIAANAAVAIARLGGEALLVTRLGDDSTGNLIRDGLAQEGVDVSISQAEVGRRSPHSAIMVDPAGERMIVAYADPAMPEAPSWLPERLPKGVAAALGDTRWCHGARHMFRLARASGLPVVLDGDRKPELPELVTLATHIAFSEQGIAEQTGISEPVAALQSFGTVAAWLAVTCGERGVYCLSNGTLVHEPAFPVKAIDTLGAGDVWHGAFALALAEGMPETEAVRFASAAAAIKCTRFGGRKGAPTRAEVDEFLRSHP